jgi:hypothetical protein
MAIPVVDRALLRVGENRIGLADLFEFFFRVGIIGIPVRMVLQCKLAVSALQLNFRDRAGHAQYFVVIAFCVRRQNKPFLGDISGETLACGIARHLHHRGPQ